MRIGNWIIRRERWVILIDHVCEAPGFATTAKKVAEYYSKEEIERWREALKAHYQQPFL